MTRINTIIPLLLTLLATSALAASGVKGRAAWRGELVPDIRVSAYRAIADIAAGKVVATSAPAELDGSYSLDLPPGDYYLTARDFTGAATPGKHFCYYSGAPVRVSAGNYSNVGFNLIRIPVEAPQQPAPTSGIRGEITFQGELLEKAYLYVYKDPGKDFKTPPYFLQPVEKGSFRLRLPPGDYYLLVRKRAKGGQFGPIEIGDYFNYYYGNPVRIEAGQVREVKIEAITRLSMLEEDSAPFRGIQGKVLGPDGKPVAGLYVFAYRGTTMTGTPDHVSAATAADGSFQLPLSDSGNYHLLARAALGGPAGPGEYYGKFKGDGNHAVTLNSKTPIREVIIHVAKTPAP